MGMYHYCQWSPSLSLNILCISEKEISESEGMRFTLSIALWDRAHFFLTYSMLHLIVHFYCCQFRRRKMLSRVC